MRLYNCVCAQCAESEEPKKEKGKQQVTCNLRSSLILPKKRLCRIFSPLLYRLSYLTRALEYCVKLAESQERFKLGAAWRLFAR